MSKASAKFRTDITEGRAAPTATPQRSTHIHTTKRLYVSLQDSKTGHVLDDVNVRVLSGWDCLRTKSIGSWCYLSIANTSQANVRHPECSGELTFST
jgi:hypothetical protein